MYVGICYEGKAGFTTDTCYLGGDLTLTLVDESKSWGCTAVGITQWDETSLPCRPRASTESGIELHLQISSGIGDGDV